MERYFSLKYKILLLLIIVPLFSSISYYLIAKTIFEEDKTAYIFDANIQSTGKIGDSLNAPKKTIDEITWIVKNFSAQINTDATKEALEAKISKIEFLEYFEIFNTADKLEILKWQNGEHKYDFKEGVLGRYYQNDEGDIFFSTAVDELMVRVVLSRNFFYRTLESTPFDAVIVMDKKGKVIFEDNKTVTKSFSDSVFSYIDKVDAQTSKTVVNRNNKKYIFSAEFLEESGFYIASFFEWEKAMKPVQNLTYQSAIYFVIIISLSIFIALLVTSRVTLGLNQVTDATKKLAQEDYNLDIKVKTNDEIKILANAFVTMAQKIKQLLSELRRYNEELEDMVAERTAELSQAYRLQKSMMDSVDEGFGIYNEEGSLKSEASAKVYTHFNVDENTKKEKSFIQKVLDLDTYKNVFQLISTKRLGFKDAIFFLPQELEVNDRNIDLKFFPYHNDEEKLDGLVIVTKDKTEEVQAIEKQKKEKEKGEMVLRVLSDKSQFTNVLKDVIIVLDMLKDPGADRQDTFLRAHGVKASLLHYRMSDVAGHIHELEEHLSEKNTDGINRDYLDEKVKALEGCFDDFFKNFGAAFGIESLDKIDANIFPKIDKTKYVSFIETKKDSGKELVQEFQSLLFKTKIREFLSFYEGYTLELARKSNKQVEIIFQDDEILDVGLGQLKASLVHLFSNAVTHGVEVPDLRQNLGKDPQAKIKVSYSEGVTMSTLLIEDDGAGIDPEIIRKKLISIGEEEAADYDKDTLVHTIFRAEFSTKDSVSSVAGRGVGMAAVKEAVEALGGSISVDTEVGRGTKFQLNIPNELRV